MKKNLFLIFILSSFIAKSQDFAPIGSIWYYNQGTINPSYKTYKTFESIKDTVINGQDCRKIIESIENTETNTQYMFSQNDSVFFFADNDFHLLYDFGAEKGDTIILDFFEAHTESGQLEMVIDSVSTIDINGISKKLQYISCGDGLVIEFGGPVIEGIGSSYYMFPTLDNHMEGTLRCYQDNDLSLFKNPFWYGGWTQECDLITTSISAVDKFNSRKIIPNPVSSSFIITDLQLNSEYSITDINGRLLMSGRVKPDEKIDISVFSKGTYIINIFSGYQFNTYRILKE